MFGIQFYPTPEPLAKKLVEPYVSSKTKGLRIFEPSAGSGALLDAYIEGYWELLQGINKETEEQHKNRDSRGYYYKREHADKLKKQCSAIEIDPELQHILTGKGYKVVGSDFLKFNTPYDFNLILMNPPFNQGAKHLLKAWDMLRGGDIACLLNKETIDNPYTEERRALKAIIDKHGSVEYVGQPFKDSDRPTDVEVVLIRLHKEAPENLNLFDDLQTADFAFSDRLEALPETEVAKRDIIGNLVDQYNMATEHYIIYRRASRRMTQLRKPFDFEYNSRNAHQPNESGYGDDTDQYNDFLQELTAAAWRTVFRLTGFEKRMTERVRKEFEQKKSGVMALAFNRENIWSVLETLVMSSGQIMLQCVLDAYDELTRYHSGNKEEVETWKTNNAFRVKRKVILPRAVGLYRNMFDLDYRTKEGIIADLDKAMCFLSGNKFENITSIADAAQEKSNELKQLKVGAVDTTCESEFFKIRFFKKGTIHLTFLDEDLWNLFNRTVAKERGWLHESEVEDMELMRV